MTAFVGRKLTLTWGGVTIGGVRQKQLTFAGAPIDITDVGDAGWQELISTDLSQMDVKVQVSGVTKDATLKTDWYAGNWQKQVIMTYPDTHTITGLFMLASYSETGTYKDAQTFSAEFMSNGVVVFA